MVSSPVQDPPAPPSANGAASSVAWPPGVDPVAVMKAPLFKDLTEAQVAKFLSRGVPRSFKAGENIITEGNTDTDVFVIFKGKVDIVKKLPPVLPGGPEGQKTIVTLMYPQFGIAAMGAPNMIGGTGRGTSVVAVEDTETIVLSKDTYEALALEDPLMGYYVTRNIATMIVKDLNDTNQRVVKLTQALTLALQKKG